MNVNCIFQTPRDLILSINVQMNARIKYSSKNLKYILCSYSAYLCTLVGDGRQDGYDNSK